MFGTNGQNNHLLTKLVFVEKKWHTFKQYRGSKSTLRSLYHYCNMRAEGENSRENDYDQSEVLVQHSNIDSAETYSEFEDPTMMCNFHEELSLTKRVKNVFSELPVVPNLIPRDFFIGTDEVYAKIMLTLFGENFVYTRRGLYYWNGNIWCNGDDQAYYTIEDLYKYMSQKLDEDSHAEATGAGLPLFDLKTWQLARGEYAERESTYNELKRELSQLKLKHFEASRRYEQEILDAGDARELKAGKKVLKLRQQAELEYKRNDLKMAQLAMEKAHKSYLEQRKEYKQYQKECEKAEKEKEKTHKNFQSKKRELRELQNHNPKKRIVEEFHMQCKRYLKIGVDMDMNDAQRGLFHFKNGCINLHTGEFRSRRKNDFVSKCLPYDYQDINDDLKIKMEEIEQKLRMIQPTDEGYNWTMDWLGYNLTGYTKEQSSICLLVTRLPMLRVHSLT